MSTLNEKEIQRYRESVADFLRLLGWNETRIELSLEQMDKRYRAKELREHQVHMGVLSK